MSDTLMLTVASEINQAHAQAIEHADSAIGFAKKAGELLLQVKADLPHGEFLPWVENNLDVTPRQAQRYMAAAQGKPTPIRKLASKATPVSYLEVKDGEAVYITRMAGNWQDDIVIYPNAEHRGYFHYAFISGQIGEGASCTYTKRGINAHGIGLKVRLDLPNWRECDIERFEHPGYASNPFMADDVAVALGTVAPPLHKNLELARELVTQFIADANIIVDGNQHLFKLLDSGDEYEVITLAGDALHDIMDDLKVLLKLASEPSERSKAKDKDAATRQREKIAMLVRTVLALLATEKAVRHE